MQYTLEQCLEQCLEQQKKVDASIKHDGTYLPWLAGIGEVIEMCEHLSLISTWKKQPEPDMKQAFMELVDVFAFALSMKNKTYSSISEDDYSWVINCETLISVIHYLIQAFIEKDFDKAHECIWVIGLKFFGMQGVDVYYYYMGKQTLTQFRQKNGYKTGDYIKIWHGREDNEYLTEYLEKGLSVEEIENALELAYSAVIKES